MKSPKSFLHPSIPVLALVFAAFAGGCAELHTNAPFGEAAKLGPKDKPMFAGRWTTAARETADLLRCELVFDATGDRGTIVTRNATGDTWTYEFELRAVKGHNSGGPVIFFKRRDRAEADWRFAWIGHDIGSKAEIPGNVSCLVLVFPDEEGAKDFGLTTTSSSYGILGSGVPGAGMITRRPEQITDAEWKKIQTAKQETRTLTGTPEEIMAKLKDKDLRTMMLPLNPLVLLRDETPVQPSAKPQAAQSPAGPMK